MLSYPPSCLPQHVGPTLPSSGVGTPSLGGRVRGRRMPLLPPSNFVNYFFLMGWELPFLIRGIGLYEKTVICIGFVFSDKGLKYQNLGLGMKKNVMLLFQMFSDFGFILEILSTLCTRPNQAM